MNDETTQDENQMTDVEIIMQLERLGHFDQAERIRGGK